MKERWWTTPTEAENGNTVIVTGRDYLEEIQKKGKFKYRVTVTWEYESLPNGMPTEEDSQMLETVTEALQSEFKKDKVAYLTGIYTGDGERDWVFYAQNLNIFSKVFNRAMENVPELPLKFEAEEDSDWEEYQEMREISYVPETDEER